MTNENNIRSQIKISGIALYFFFFVVVAFLLRSADGCYLPARVFFILSSFLK